MSDHQIIHGDCLDAMRDMPDNSVDLVVTSPPYENARDYGIGFNLKGQDWVDWAVERYIECVRVSRGLVAWVLTGRTKSFKWTATPALFMADLHRMGVCLRNPPLYKRVGIPGSGGPDWLRNDYEWVVCATKGGRLPWSNNTAMGHAPKYNPGGNPTHRLSNGKRCHLVHTKTMPNGEKKQGYTPPKVANPGNVIECHGGGGHMGSKLAHENEAPFPEKLPEFFVRSFCPPNGIVLDPFAGSGTTAKVAGVHGRKSVSIDIRDSQTDLVTRRISEIVNGDTRNGVKP